MHDIDRTQLEADYESEEPEFEGFEGEDEESEEMVLAGELLAVGNEAELDQFLGKLIKKAGRAVGRVASSPVGRMLGQSLKKIAKQALPMAGKALGAMGAAYGIPPSVGMAVGGKLASGLGSAFGLELEGLSPEDQEFEVARRFVRFAKEAAKGATAQAGLDPRTIASSALRNAAKRHAPGLLSTLGGGRVSGLVEAGTPGLLSEAEEMELASELLEVSDEGEVDQFFGKLFKGAARAVGKVARSPIGQVLKGHLKQLGAKALPSVAGALGLPPGMSGGLGSMFGLQGELEAEDEEYESARRFVRMSADAAQRVLGSEGDGSPVAAVRSAVASAAQRHAPGLYDMMRGGEQARAWQGGAPRGTPSQPRAGQWVRHGNRIILFRV
ncbi:MAG: hypothetical protein HUU21_05225 [Polyangiaceae bacterium]|nr:hypothetical protein [Polyangiaceae bacterium]